MNFKDVKNIKIPDGVVVKITSNGVVLWMKKGVEPDTPDYPELPNGNEIWYKTIDGNIITPTSLPTDNTLISNTYKNGKGVMTFENNITEIDDNMFYRNNTLLSIVIPDGVTLISGFEFYNCTSLKEITISNSVTSIGNNTFTGCISLNKITSLNPIAPTLSYNVFFELPEVGTLYVPKGSSGYDVWLKNLPDGWSIQYIVPDVPDTPDNPDVPNIPNNEIHYRTNNVSTITLNSSLGKLISNTYNHEDGSGGVMVFENDITKINNEAFRYIKTLTAVTVPSSVTSIGDYAFANCSDFRKLYSQNTIKSFGTGAFFACVNLNDVVVSNSVTSIGDECFAYCGFKEITLPNSLKTISTNMLYGCDQLKTVTIGNSVTSILTQAFAFCYQLRTITCLAMVAPTITSDSFKHVGTQVAEGTPKILYVPQGATGYETWLKQLPDGWELQYITE